MRNRPHIFAPGPTCYGRHCISNNKGDSRIFSSGGGVQKVWEAPEVADRRDYSGVRGLLLQKTFSVINGCKWCPKKDEINVANVWI